MELELLPSAGPEVIVTVGIDGSARATVKPVKPTSRLAFSRRAARYARQAERWLAVERFVCRQRATALARARSAVCA